MKLLLLMSASWSLMVVFYFLFKVFVKGRVIAKWRYRMLKAALFFYLIGNCVIRRMRSQVRKANLQRMRSILFYLIPVQAVKTQWKSIYYNCYTHRDIQVQWLNGELYSSFRGICRGIP